MVLKKKLKTRGNNIKKKNNASKDILARISVLFALSVALLILLTPTTSTKCLKRKG